MKLNESICISYVQELFHCSFCAFLMIQIKCTPQDTPYIFKDFIGNSINSIFHEI